MRLPKIPEFNELNGRKPPFASLLNRSGAASPMRARVFVRDDYCFTGTNSVIARVMR
jgi:hypothetical protein